MARIFCVANQKGGVGKTTTCVNLAAALHLAGQRTLLVDLDPQGNATMGSGVDKRTLDKSVYHLLVGLATLDQARAASPTGGFDVLPANRDLAGAEVELVDLARRENRLRDALAACSDQRFGPCLSLVHRFPQGATGREDAIQVVDDRLPEIVARSARNRGLGTASCAAGPARGIHGTGADLTAHGDGRTGVARKIDVVDPVGS